VHVALAAALLASCGGLIDAPGAADDGRGAPSDSAPGTSLDAGAGADTGHRPPDPKPPNPVERCTFEEGPWLLEGSGRAEVKLSVRLLGGHTVLFVDAGGALARYHVASESPCVLESEIPDAGANHTSFGGYTETAVDDVGTIWSSHANGLRRIYPLPQLKCTVGRGYLDADGFPIYYVGSLFLDADGKGGWGLEGPPGRLGRLTLGPDACSVDLADSPWGDLPVRSDTPRDAQGRLHVLDAPAAGAIGIFTSTGTLVKTYSGKSAPTDPPPVDATSCAGGICVLDSDDSGQSLVYLDDEGAPRAKAVPLIKGLYVSRIAAARSGPVFGAGDSDPALEPLHQVVIQIAPPPPP
jgi:hypothetical protein